MLMGKRLAQALGASVCRERFCFLVCHAQKCIVPHTRDPPMCGVLTGVRPIFAPLSSGGVQRQGALGFVQHRPVREAPQALRTNYLRQRGNACLTPRVGASLRMRGSRRQALGCVWGVTAPTLCVKRNGSMSANRTLGKWAVMRRSNSVPFCTAIWAWPFCFFGRVYILRTVFGICCAKYCEKGRC